MIFPPSFPRPLGACLLTAALGLTLSACETDLDPNDSYRETALIYAALDPGQAVQRISINKAFVNTASNALTIAANRADSVTFPAGVLDASLQILNRADSSLIGSAYPLERVVNTVKDAGPFARVGQVVYQTPPGFPGVSATDTTRLYRVVARNTRTGTVAYATTDVPIVLPLTGSAGYRYLHFRAAGGSIPQAQQSQVREFDPGRANQRVEVRTQRRAGVYSVELDFHFFEIVGADTVARTLTWPIITNVLQDAARDAVGTPLPENSLFTQFLNRQINPANDPAGLRRIWADTAIVWRATAGSPQWARYLEISNSSSALTQTTPEFTNVRGGRGLVTGRAQFEVYQKLNPATFVSTATRDAFRDLRFVF